MATDHPKSKRRRRRTNQSPVTGWLKPSEQIKGNIGRISASLHAELSRNAENQDPSIEDLLYIAITACSPPFSDHIEDAAWTLLPVQLQNRSKDKVDEAGSHEVLISEACPALRALSESPQSNSIVRSSRRQEQGFKIRILDVEPLELARVYVTIDGDALRRHDEMQERFGGGFDYTRTNRFQGKGKGKGKAKTQNEMEDREKLYHAQRQEAELTSAVREALKTSGVVRQHDRLPLPLPAHPITHVPLPPAQITLCEPVGQGLLADTTRIIVNRTTPGAAANAAQPNDSDSTLYTTVLENGNDTTNERFFSAEENDMNEETSGSERGDFDSDNSGGSSSDDSALISMDAPQLPSKSSDVASARMTATPRAGSVRNGISTPGSVFSNLTATTARQDCRTRPRQFHARALSCRIPDDILHPKPSADEDDEARVYIDIKILSKLGCFSGDWVKIEIAATRETARAGSWGADEMYSAFSSGDSRPVKVYGLPDLCLGFTNRYPKRGGSEQRRSSVTLPDTKPATLSVWMSPILLFNLGQPSQVTMVPLIGRKGISNLANDGPRSVSLLSPPVASEMTLLRLSTPLSTERALQNGIFSALKHYFESKRRILRQGDTISLPIDVEVNRLLTQAAGAVDLEHELEQLFSVSSGTTSRVSTRPGIVWFKVGHITMTQVDEGSSLPSLESWGGSACIEPLATRMRQAGSECNRVPSTLDNPWQYYLGMRPLPRSSNPRRAGVHYDTIINRQYVSPLRRRLRELIAAATSPQALLLRMEPVVVLVHSTQRNIGKTTLATSAAEDLGLHVFDIDAQDITSEGGSTGDVKSEALLKARVERAISCGPASTVVLLRHIDALTADRMAAAFKEVVSGIRVLIATTAAVDKIPDGVRSLFTHELELNAPDEAEREGILKTITEDRAISLAQEVDLASIAIKSAALVAGDLVDIVDRAVIARQDRLEHLSSKICSNNGTRSQFLVRDALVSGGEAARCVIQADFDVAVEAARKNFADAIGAPKIPNVSWDDVGGLENVKDAVMETIQLPLERPELFAKGMKKRSGILFYGPPGTGKTLLAKAIATEFSLNFFSVKGPELLNMYIGESEANVRRVFQRARDAKPCVVFFDELDSVAPKRGNQGDSGGVMDRIVSQLLAELDGMSDGDEDGGGVFVIGATNRPDLLDQALLRPGRFDKMLYLGISDTHDKQLTIIEALTRKFTIDPNSSLRRVAESLPFTYTGADLYALCSDAMLKAITRQASAVDAKIKQSLEDPMTTAYFFDHLATDEDIAVMVKEEDFFAAQRELVGSVSAKELDHYHRVRQTFEGPSKTHDLKAPANATRIPAPSSNGHLKAPAKITRPNMASRTSTIKPRQSIEFTGTRKGKATQWDSDDEDDDDAYVTSNDFSGTPERKQSNVNGFGDANEHDEEELYG